jgi:hypothetical protein
MIDWLLEEELSNEPHSVLVGDSVWSESRRTTGRFDAGQVLSVNKEENVLIIGWYGRFSYDPYFTDYSTLELSDFQEWVERKVGRSGTLWKLWGYG